MNGSGTLLTNATPLSAAPPPISVAGLPPCRACTVGDVPLLLTADGVAALLGVGKRHIDGLRAAGKLPAPIRLGRSIRWSRAELEAWARHGCPARERWEPIWRDQA